MSGTSDTIVAAAVARASGRLGPLTVEAPDEDPFTLAVAAAEALPAVEGTPGLGRIDLVGDFDSDAEWGVLEALDLPAVPVHRTPGGPSHLFEALAPRAPPADGGRLVIAADRSRLGPGDGTPHGAAAVALRLGSGAGLVLRDVATHTAGARSARAFAWLVRAGSAPSDARPRVWLTGDDESVKSSMRSAASAALTPAVVPHALPGLGPAPTVSAAVALRALGADPEERGARLLVAFGPTTEALVSAEVTGPVAWTEARMGGPVALSAPPDPARGLDARAEGAYWPHDRYVEGIRSRWRLEAERCPNEGFVTFPAHGACAKCGRSTALETLRLPRDGWTVEAATTVHPGAHPTEFDPLVTAGGAYDVVIARAPNGPRATFQGTGPSGAVRIGGSVDLVLRRLYPMEGAWRYGRKALPQAPATGA